jgi:hypothetical protein
VILAKTTRKGGFCLPGEALAKLGFDLFFDIIYICDILIRPFSNSHWDFFA